MKVKFVDLATGSFPYQQEIKKAIEGVLKRGSYILGKEVENFERQFARYIGTKFCVGVANGYEAIQISLLATPIKKGDEVITTPFSATATTLAIVAVGAKPVFVDTDEEGLINPVFVSKAINPKTKAILPVHLYGQPSKIDEFKNICQKYNLYLIEDASQAHGSTYNGLKLGSFGSFGCFSFYPTKNLGALGDAGAIVTNNIKWAKICRQLRNYGQSDQYNHLIFGLNSRLDEIQAAILRVKLKYLDRENQKRQTLAKRYIKNLASLPFKIVTSQVPSSNFHLFVIRSPKRSALQKFLSRNDIQTFIHYPKIIPDQPFFKSKNNNKFPNARKLASEVLSLPCYPHLSIRQIDYICAKIKEFFRMP